MALGRSWGYLNEAHFDRYGRIAAERVRSPIDRFWLQAEVSRRWFYVRSWTNSGRTLTNSGRLLMTQSRHSTLQNCHSKIDGKIP